MSAREMHVRIRRLVIDESVAAGMDRERLISAVQAELAAIAQTPDAAHDRAEGHGVTGIGSAVARGIVQRLGGDVFARDAQGSGGDG
jgi:hypothetical protein